MSDLTLFEQFQDRCRGLMVGLGIGNVLGVPQEGWPRHAVEASYPDGIREIEMEPGEPDDDDLAQAIILAEAAIEAGAGDLDVEEIGRRFWVWAEENGRGIGIQTADVLSLIGGVRPRCGAGLGLQAREPTGLAAVEAARQAWEESGRYSAGNGAVMRCAPLAIRWLRDDVALARNTALSAVTTHADPRCVWSSILINVAVAMWLRGEDVAVSEVVKRTRRAASELGDSLAALGVAGAVPETVVDGCSISGGIAPADLALDGHDMGYTLKAMQVALWCATQATDFEEALVAVVSAGGDTDTNGAVAGAVLGARFGLKAIPSRWRWRLAEIRPGSETLEVLADRCVAASG
ncbi:MAG: ADP-ribosylglycohydrolase family protein [Acidobacteria bacterium]|nr:ADP-ribosylglycohydrolase family protein [Acidobacteriota bacterium]